MEQPLVPLPAPARKEFGAEDIAPYRKVRIYENTSFPIMIPDGASSVSDDAPSEEKKLFTDSEDTSINSDDASSLGVYTLSEEELFADLDRNIAPRYEGFELLWNCCNCGGGPYSCRGSIDVCLEFNCGHAYCRGCHIESHKF
jgi:hypothetical protein